MSKGGPIVWEALMVSHIHNHVIEHSNYTNYIVGAATTVPAAPAPALATTAAAGQMGLYSVA